jgi:hypothetical protein
MVKNGARKSKSKQENVSAEQGKARESEKKAREGEEDRSTRGQEP